MVIFEQQPMKKFQTVNLIMSKLIKKMYLFNKLFYRLSWICYCQARETWDGWSISEVWGWRPQLPETTDALGAKPQPSEKRGSGSGAPGARKFCIFFGKNYLILELF